MKQPKKSIRGVLLMQGSFWKWRKLKGKRGQEVCRRLEVFKDVL